MELYEPTIRAAWDSYRAVSALWAAHLALTMQFAERAFPCLPNRLSLYLATSEQYRREGEAFKPKQSPHGPVLEHGQCWRVSSEVAALLPPVTLTTIALNRSR